MLRISKTLCFACTLFDIGCGGGFAMQITDFVPAVNNRFASGYPTAPVKNTAPAFIGANFDWSAVGWSTTKYGQHYKGLGTLSPIHFLTALHFEYNNETTKGVQILGCDGQTHAASTNTISNLGQGLLLTNGGFTNYDLAIGSLISPLTTPENMTRHAALDLHTTSSSNTLSNYNGLPILLYGRSSTTDGSPRVGATTINQTYAIDSDPKQLVIRTTRNEVRLEGGDSASPALYGWTNPDGESELTILGTNSAIDTTNGYNYISFLGSTAAIAAANQVMNQDGFALRIVGNPARTWVGGVSGQEAQKDDLFKNGNWNSSSSPSDLFVLFNASSTAWPIIDVNAVGSLRGLYFKSTMASSDGFTFGGAGPLTIGRGGITNYDADPQTFTSPLVLGAHQHWNAGPGGIIVSNLNTNGNLLEIRSQGGSIIQGTISGSGGIALEKGRLTLNGASSYSGKTWIHDGHLTVNGDIASSQRVITGVTTLLSGTGIVPIIEGAGSISAGSADGILTSPSLVTSAGMDFHFEFTQSGSPAYGQTGSSGNDVLRLTAASPFSQALLPTSVIRIYLDLPPPDSIVVLRGGFFTDNPLTATSQISGATYQFYLADDNGPISHNSKNYSIFTGVTSVTMVPETADFSNAIVNGAVMEITLSPDPTSYAGWAVENFPESVPPELRLADADANQDGISNLIAYALRLDPMSDIYQDLPKMEVIENSVSFQFRRNKIASDLTLTVQSTTTLDNWDTAPEIPVVIIADPDGDGGAEMMEIQSTLTPEIPRRLFRLKAALQ